MSLARFSPLLAVCVALAACGPDRVGLGIDVDALLDASGPDRVVLRYEEAAGMGPEAYHGVQVFADGRVIMSDGPAWLLDSDGSTREGVGAAGEVRRWQLNRAELVDLLDDVLATGISELPEQIEDRRPIMDGAGLYVLIATGGGSEHRVSAGNERPSALRRTSDRIARFTGWHPVDFTVAPRG